MSGTVRRRSVSPTIELLSARPARAARFFLAETMSFCLRPDIFFCRVGDRLIFLDVTADRYYCLSGPAEAAFARLVDDGAQEDLSAELVPLHAKGLLIEQPGCHAPSPCALQIPELSLLDESLPRVGALPTLAALGDLAASRARLKTLGLRWTLAGIRRRKANVLDPRNVDLSDELRRTMAAFRRADGIVSTLDNCLSQSVAVAGRLLKQGVRTNLVMGVRLGPFNAHCWVQRDDQLVNDRFDMVRMFTPILVI